MKNKKTKVPVVIQMEALECGAACIAMILAYYEKWLPLEQVRTDCGVSRDGSNCKNMMLAARAYGLNANAYKCGVEEAKELSLPAIIHWNFNHFVVLTGFSKDRVYINDPARGKVAVSMREFDESFTGVALCFSPGESFQKGGKPKSVLKFVRKRLKGTLIPIIFVMLTSVISGAIEIIQPAFGRVFYDRLLGVNAKNPEWIVPFLVAISLFVLIQIVQMAIETVYRLKIQGKVAIIGSTTFMWHVLRLPMEFFSQRLAGDIASRQSTNANIANTLIDQLSPVVIDVFLLILYLWMMISNQWILTIIGLSTLLINILIARYSALLQQNVARGMMRDSGKLASSTMSGIDMIETVKSSGAENGFFERWSGFFASFNSAQVRAAKIAQYIGSVQTIITTLTSIAVTGAGVYFIMKGNFTVGLLMQFTSYLSLFNSPINKFISLGTSFIEMRTSMERIEDVMSYETDVEFDEDSNIENEECSKLSGELEMKDVTFGYNRLSGPLIENFNLKLKPGSRVAFVGASGCGKSTLAKLISGLYQPWSGSITFDGKKREDIRREVFAGSLAVVDQDKIMFEDSVSDNIKMWDESIEDFEVILAARDAQIHDDIVKRSDGYSEKVLENGKNFSGGQIQRFEIARVLAQDPSIIIMDEATSALDAKTEFEVMKAIKNRGISCVIVAHRLSTIRDCDEIIVMDHGKIVERGTHEQLYKNGGLYTKLVSNE